MKALLRKVRNKNTYAESCFYNTYKGWVNRNIHSYRQDLNYEDRQDIQNEVLRVAIKKIQDRTIHNLNQVEPYMFGTIKNLTRRKQGRQKRKKIDKLIKVVI